MHAYILVDLGFGDAGKGLITDFLARQKNAGLVVRYNGGAQAGHNVVTPEGRHHTFSQFGSATFLPGVKTYLSQYMVVHPGALFVEEEALQDKGVTDAFSRLAISEQALLVTPFHQAANHIRELARGASRHGSCGVGIGETVVDALDETIDCIRAADARDIFLLKRKLKKVRDRKKEQLSAAFGSWALVNEFGSEWDVFLREDVIDNWAAAVYELEEMGVIKADDCLSNWLKSTETTVFEGAQGVLLDADKGFHPYTTWSDCTASNAAHLLDAYAPQAEVTRIGILRSHAVRHGPGPLPTENGLYSAFIHEHNQTNPWQREIRYGHFDAVLANYALEVTGHMDILALTHLDLLQHLNNWKYCTGYNVSRMLEEEYHFLNMIPGNDLERREQLTRALLNAKPVYRNCGSEEETVIGTIEELTGHKIGITVRGQTCQQAKFRGQ